MPTRQSIVYVHLKDGPAPAGRLTFETDGRASYATFAYGTQYLARPDRVAVDPVSLPLPAVGETRQFVSEEGFWVFNGVRDAAPDGWGQYLMAKAAGDRPLDDIDMLLASGEHRVGALAFGPDLTGPSRITPWGSSSAPGEILDLAELAQAIQKVQTVDELDEGLRRLLTAGPSLGGARPKAGAELEGQDWIAKFPARNDQYPICRIELATMRLAAECGLNVPELSFRTAFDQDIYLIRRFDRLKQGGEERRIPFASGLTMLAAHEMEASRYSYADLAGALRREGTAVREDMRELFARMVFNILVTNDDDHLRNHGFLFDGQGWRLSPLYDVVPKPQVSRERQLVLGVGPEGRQATLTNAGAGAAAFALTPQEADAIIESQVRIVRTRWDPLYQEAGVSRADRRRFATCFRLADPVIDV